MHYTQEERPPGWEEYVRENAVALVERRDLKIARLREAVTKLHKTVRALRRLRPQTVWLVVGIKPFELLGVYATEQAAKIAATDADCFVQEQRVLQWP